MSYDSNFVSISKDSIINNQNSQIQTQCAKISQLEETSHYLAYCNNSLHCSLNEKDAEIDRLRQSNQALQRSRKRKHIKDKIVIGPDQHLYLNRYYDDNTFEPISLLLPFYGLAKTYRVVFSDYSAIHPCLLILIDLEGSEHGQGPSSILLDSNRLNNKHYIYDSFCRAHVSFNSMLKETDIKNALKTYILEQDGFHDLEEWVLHGLPGWIIDENGPYFQSSERSGFKNNPLFSSLPVVSKSFRNLTQNTKSFPSYFHELNIWFPELRDRIIMLLTPFIGLLYTLLTTWTGTILRFTVNLVANENFMPEYAASWLQIYNRPQFEVVDAALPLNQLKKIIIKMKDDVLLLDARTYSGEEQYSKKKKQTAMAQLPHLVKNGLPLHSNQKINCIVVFLSNEILQGNAINVILPDVDNKRLASHRMFLREICFDQLLCALVEYIENNVNNVCRIIRKNRSGANEQANLLEAVFDLLAAFFKEEGYDLNHALNIPNSYNFADLFEKEEGDDLESFVALVQSAICEYVSCPKHRGTAFDSSVLYYDNEWLYFPQPLLRQIYRDAHLDTQLNRTLILLRNANCLYPDVENGTTKKVQFSGTCQYVYVIRRSLFQTPGDLEIIDWTKEKM